MTPSAPSARKANAVADLDTTTLLLELGREKDRAEAFKATMTTEVLKVIRVAIIQATIDADEEIARLKEEVETLQNRCDFLEEHIDGLSKE